MQSCFKHSAICARHGIYDRFAIYDITRSAGYIEPGAEWLKNGISSDGSDPSGKWDSKTALSG
jgi:hypothetical protein